MNLLEHYIKEIVSVEPYEEDWTKEFDKKFLKVVVVVNCYGVVETRGTVVTENEWEIAKERGYFMW
ncbi:hypothetical protein BK126_04545 [Paenibacillus sp. FSL H7-0326]|uniref:hypothetical protein n=1 Tax=Paenibacillus sp. FSL H7-0326 TaxID=1921144 RepID=UPI00096CC42B|nr:hypothetical protein [Paenibacillus sp. FSL H7-0326]OMC71372.1 hypothetical protein BK126_04545 [Paenibacillus sp. FSL H7-0326]